MLEVGDTMPPLEVADESGKTLSTNDLLGKRLVIYFYPKADTPGCTTESIEFRDHYGEFQEAGAEIVGVSRDTPADQRKFKEKFALPFHLLADVDSKVCDAFGVIVEKNMYGKVSKGIQRSTFVVGPTGTIERAWPKVKPEGHAAEVLDELKAEAFQ